MGHPKLSSLRDSIGSRILKGRLNGIDITALLAGIALVVWVQTEIPPKTNSLELPGRIITAPFAFVIGASGVYALWYLPQILISLLRTYWWVVLLIVMAWLAWVDYAIR